MSVMQGWQAADKTHFATMLRCGERGLIDLNDGVEHKRSDDEEEEWSREEFERALREDENWRNVSIMVENAMRAIEVMHGESFATVVPDRAAQVP
ncbi:hypothetical protein E2542_SST03607 [Spatholobus suberectus]|nr:hypothetical protein E2542_SST03607 [Spatholobus suberectus]